METSWPGRMLETPGPRASTTPAASAPMTSGILRLAKAMPRQPQTSIWLRATALTRSVTSPGPGASGSGISVISSLRSSRSWRARMVEFLSGRFGRHHEAGVLAAEAEGVGQNRRDARIALHVRHDIQLDRRVGVRVVDGGRQGAGQHGLDREHRLDRAG